MVELRPVSAFAGLLSPIGFGAGVSITERTGLGLATLIAGADRAAFDARMVERHGASLDDGPQRTILHGLSFIGTAPGTWLAIGDNGQAFAASLAEAVAGAGHVADQSGAYGVLRLTGPKVHEVLAKGLGIDLHPKAFSGDAAVTSQISHLNVTLWPVDDDPPGYDLVLARSSVGSFWHWLSASAHEFGLAVA